MDSTIFNSGYQEFLDIKGSLLARAPLVVSTDANFSGTSNNVTLPGSVVVKTENCLMYVGCHNDTATGNKEGDKNLCNVSLSTTQVTLTKSSSTAGSYVYVINILEFLPGVISQNFYETVATTSSNGYADITLSGAGSVDTSKSIAIHHGHTTTETNNYLQFSNFAELQSSTSVRLGAQYTGTSQTKNVRGQVVEFIR